MYKKIKGYPSLMTIRIDRACKNSHEVMITRTYIENLVNEIKEDLLGFMLGDSVHVLTTQSHQSYILLDYEYLSYKTVELVYVTLEKIIKEKMDLDILKLKVIVIPLYINLLEEHFKNHKSDKIKNYRKVVKELLILGIINTNEKVFIIDRNLLGLSLHFYFKGYSHTVYKPKIFIQPKVNAINNKYLGGEVLTRFYDESGNQISPLSFIPVLNSLGLTRDFDEVILRESLNELQKNHHLYKGVKLSVNMSLTNFMTYSILDRLENIFSEYPREVLKNLEIEVTEYDLFRRDSVDILEKAIEIFHDYGVSIALDDVGSIDGNAGINLLASLNIDVVKVDKYLVDNMTTDRGCKAVLALKKYCDTLDSQVIVEGVEREEQVNQLVDMGITNIQGFFYSKPIPVVDFRYKLMSNMMQSV